MSDLGCAGACPREQTQADPVSLGVVSNDEPIARGAFHPSHIKKGKITNQIMKPGDIYEGHCSVWRLKPVGLSAEELAPILTAGRENRLHQIVAVPAAKIRDIAFAGGGRAFCVVDECDCDQNGGKHEAHVHIALCETAKANGVGPQDENFVQVYRSLVGMFRNASPVWVLPEALAA